MIENLNLSQNKFDLSTAKTYLEELVQEVQTNRAPKIIMKDDKPAVVLVNAEVYQSILDYLEKFEEADDISVVQEIEARISRGEEKLYSLEEVEAELDDLPD